MNIFNCTFASAAPSSFLVWALAFYAIGMVSSIAYAADRIMRGSPVTTRATLVFLAVYTAAFAVAGPLLVAVAANGYMPVRACLPNPLAALWVTVLGVVAFPAVVALRHVYRQRKERAHSALFPYAMGNFSGARTERLKSAQPATSAMPSR